MKLIFIHKEKDTYFEVDLPKKDKRHRVPQLGHKITFEDDNLTHIGEVVDVQFKYKVFLGVFKRTEIEITVEEYA